MSTLRRTDIADRPAPVDVDGSPQEPIDPAHLAAVLEGLADIEAGRIATDEEIEAAFARFGQTPA